MSENEQTPPIRLRDGRGRGVIGTGKPLVDFTAKAEAERPWQAGDVVQGALSGQRHYLMRHGPESWGATSENGLHIAILDAAVAKVGAYVNLGPHRIEPDGNGGLRFVKIEDAPPAPTQPDPDRLSRGEFMALVGVLFTEWSLPDAVKQVEANEPAIIAALKGRA